MPLLDSINTARQRGASDDRIIQEILKQNPNKGIVFQEATNRGANSTQILNEVLKQTNKQKPETFLGLQQGENSLPARAVRGLGNIFKGGAEEVQENFQAVPERIRSASLLPDGNVDTKKAFLAAPLASAEFLGRTAGTVAKTVGRFFGEPIGAGISTLSDKISESKAVQKFATRPEVSGLLEDISLGAGSIASKIEDLRSKNPDLAKDVEALGETVLLAIGEKPTEQAIRKSLQSAKNTLERAGNEVLQVSANAKSNLIKPIETKVKSLFTREAKTVEEVIDMADVALRESPSVIRKTAEETASQVGLKEKFINITPDIKKRLQQAGPKKVQEYIDVVNARNLDDTVPTPYEFGANQARKAADEMQALLDDTGGNIGATRTKLSTIKADIDAVGRIEQSFVQQIERLNLELVDGVVRQAPGTISRVGSASDIKVMNELFQELKILKQDPTLTNLIDFRGILDSRVNFAKRAGDASSSVDPLSRQVRKVVAEEAGNIVGKEGSAELAKYSEFITALNDLKSFTDRRAGGEFLLRLSLSGRGGEARQVIKTIKEFTGIDLMDDATLMTLVTDLIGNQNTKNLFRQEVTKGGFDVLRVLSGDPKGAIDGIGKFLKDKFLDEEKILLESSRTGGILDQSLNTTKTKSIVNTTPKNPIVGSKPQTIDARQLISHEGAPDRSRVESFKKAIQAGESVQPIKVIKEGNKFGIEDGKHRFQAYKELGITEIPVEIVQGRNVI